MLSLGRGGIARTLAPWLFLITVFFFLFPVEGHSGQWRVAPVMIYLDQQAKSSVVTVVNEGEDTIHLQGKAMEWSQDPEGKDVYQETKDLIFFPRILMLKKGEQKIVRTGIRQPATSKEKTYRLFIEEIPQPKKDTAGASQLTVTVRFGIPVFVNPLKAEPAAELASVTLTKGVLGASIENTGNVHFRITEIAVAGKNGGGEEIFTEKLNGWYLLAGANRNYSVTIPLEKCTATEQLDITISTDSKITLNRQLNVDKSRCLP